jgi:hypothetical protein
VTESIIGQPLLLVRPFVETDQELDDLMPRDEAREHAQPHQITDLLRDGRASWFLLIAASNAATRMCGFRTK